MDCDNPVPRVNFELLQQYLEKRVRLVCKIERVEGNTAVVTAADGGSVIVNPSGNSKYDGQYVEIEGIVKSPNTIDELEVTSFGDTDFDMATYNELVKLQNSQHSHLFV